MANDDLEKIIAGCKKGREADFAALVDMYSRAMYGYFYRLSGNPEVSNDLLGELMLKLVTKISSYRGGSFNKWIYTVASNLFRDYLRTRQKQKEFTAQFVDEARHADQSDPQKDYENTEQLQTYLNRLDTDTADLLTLRFYSRLSFKEIAEIRSEPVGTVLSRVHRALGKLKEMMENKNEPVR